MYNVQIKYVKLKYILYIIFQEESLPVLCPATDTSSQTENIQTNKKEVQTIYEKEVFNAKMLNMILKISNEKL